MVRLLFLRASVAVQLKKAFTMEFCVSWAVSNCGLPPGLRHLSTHDVSPGVCARRIRRSYFNAVGCSAKVRGLFLSPEGHARMKLRKPERATTVSRERVAGWVFQMAAGARILLRLNSIPIPLAIEVE